MGLLVKMEQKSTLFTLSCDGPDGVEHVPPARCLGNGWWPLAHAHFMKKGWKQGKDGSWLGPCCSGKAVQHG